MSETNASYIQNVKIRKSTIPHGHMVLRACIKIRRPANAESEFFSDFAVEGLLHFISPLLFLQKQLSFILECGYSLFYVATYLHTHIHTPGRMCLPALTLHFCIYLKKEVRFCASSFFKPRKLKHFKL